MSRPHLKIKRGDTVKVLSGKDRGKRGKVIKVFPGGNQLIVEGTNLKKRHRRSRRQDRKGEVVLLPAPISASAAQIVCPHCSKPTRIGSRTNDSGERQRICKKCGTAIQ